MEMLCCSRNKQKKKFQDFYGLSQKRGFAHLKTPEFPQSGFQLGETLSMLIHTTSKRLFKPLK